MFSKNIKFAVMGLWMIVAASSCNTTKHLPPGKSLVKKTSIVFKNQEQVANKNILETELLTLAKQKPNSKFFFFVPREWLYYSSLKSQGQEPVIFNDSITKKSAKDMENYLRFKKGYYHAIVDYVTEEKSKQESWETTTGRQVWQELSTQVTYIVALGDRYKVKSIHYEGDDPVLVDKAKSFTDGSFVKVNDYISFESFEQERHRISSELQNAGYQGFSVNSIEIQGDSSVIDKEIDIFIKFRNPQGKKYTRYTVGTVNVYTDYIKEAAGLRIFREKHEGIDYVRQSQRYLVSPRLLNDQIFLRPGQLLRKDDRNRTFNKLTNLSTYRFVSINPTKDPLVDTLMNFDIILNPHINRWVLDGELGGYLSTLNSKYLWGVKTSASLQNRNAFGGSENYALNIELGTELGRVGDNDKFAPRTATVSVQNILQFPTFKDYLGLGRSMAKLGVIRPQYFKKFSDEATTNVQAGYSYFSILNFYDISSFSSGYGYDYSTDKSNRYIFRPLGLNLDIYDVQDASLFENNPLGLLSFQDNLGTGFLFRDFAFGINKSPDRKGRSWSFYNNIEVSGFEVDMVNRLGNLFAGKSQLWKLNDVSFAKYVRNEADIRYRKDFSKTNAAAFRFNLGGIFPFGSERISPFVKQFGAGGPNSMRGWRLRELGPGGYFDPTSFVSQIPFPFVNQGDIKIELNGEYRFKIISFVDAAVFADVGNVWTLRKDTKRPLANFSTDFYKQMAISTGWGLRFNFNYFIIRFDFGYKIRSPYKDPRTNKYWYSGRDISSQGIGNVQVAVNYPF